jgi:hypothetical protein
MCVPNNCLDACIFGFELCGHLFVVDFALATFGEVIRLGFGFEVLEDDLVAHINL